MVAWPSTEARAAPLTNRVGACAPGVPEGFALHASTHLHANDRQWLERLCRYGARGALALERLSRAEDGRIAWRMKRPLPDGTTRLFFTGLELLRRVASLIPPPRSNLTRFHGVFAPGAKLRPFLLLQAEAEAKPEEASELPLAATRQEPTQERTPRLDWAGLLKQEFRAGRVRLRQVWRQAPGAGVSDGSQWGACHPGAAGTAHAAWETGPSTGATPERVVLSARPQWPPCPSPVPRP
nr:transposase [Corallococcus sp. CA047B]